MSVSVQLVILGFALGFAISAIISNVFQLVTSEGSMHFPVTNDARRLMIVGLLLVAGPHILFAAGRRSLRIGDWPFAYVAGCFILGTFWAFALGLCVIHVFIV